MLNSYRPSASVKSSSSPARFHYCSTTPSPLWEDECKKFFDSLGLDAHERRKYENTSWGELVETVEAQCRIREEKRSSRLLNWTFQKTKPVVDKLESYGKALDTLSNTNGLYLCPIWGAVRFAMQFVINATEEKEILRNMLEDSALAIQDLARLEHVFEEEQLSTAIQQVYRTILRFFRSSELKSIKADFDKSLKRVKTIANGLTREMVRYTRDGVQDLQKSRHEEKLARIHAWLRGLSDYDRQYHHNRLCKIWKKMPASSQWLLELTKFHDWETDEMSKGFWLSGIPGSGKTVLMSRVIDHIENSKDGSLLLFYYCDWQKKATLEAETLMRSLLHQALLAVYNSRLDMMESILLQWNGHVQRRPSEDDLLESLITVITTFPRVFILVDGIHDCENRHESETMLRFLESLSRSLSGKTTTLKLLLSTRDEEDIRDALYARGLGSMEIDRHWITVSDIEPDIHRFIEFELEERTKSHPGRLRFLMRLETRKEIFDALSTGATGMFLWVSLQLKEIVTAGSLEELREVLSNLPKDLDTTYSRALKKLNPEQTKRNKQVFRWIMFAYRPLQLQELQECLAVRNGANSVLSMQGRTLELETIREACATLVAFDLEDNAVRNMTSNKENGDLESQKVARFCHSSVRAFLLGMDPEKAFGTVDGELQIHNMMARTCLTYISFVTEAGKREVSGRWHNPEGDPLGAYLERKGAPNELRDSNRANVAIRTLQINLESDRAILRTTETVTRWRGVRHRNFSTALNIPGEPSDEDDKIRTFHFLNYAQEHWHTHIGHLKIRADEPELPTEIRECLDATGILQHKDTTKHLAQCRPWLPEAQDNHRIILTDSEHRTRVLRWILNTDHVPLFAHVCKPLQFSPEELELAANESAALKAWSIFRLVVKTCMTTGHMNFYDDGSTRLLPDPGGPRQERSVVRFEPDAWLMSAVSFGKYDEVEFILDNVFSPLASGQANPTFEELTILKCLPLAAAINSDEVTAIFELLCKAYPHHGISDVLEASASIIGPYSFRRLSRHQYEERGSPLYVAAENYSLSTIELIMSNPIALRIIGPDPSALKSAVRNRQVSVVYEFSALRYDRPPIKGQIFDYFPDSDWLECLFHACQLGSYNCVRIILETLRSPDPLHDEGPDADSNSAHLSKVLEMYQTEFKRCLFIAIERRQDSVVSILLEQITFRTSPWEVVEQLMASPTTPISESTSEIFQSNVRDIITRKSRVEREACIMKDIFHNLQCVSDPAFDAIFSKEELDEKYLGTLIRTAALMDSGAEELLCQVLSWGIPIDSPLPGISYSPAGDLTRMDCSEAVSLLLKYGADPNKGDLREGSHMPSLLHIAADDDAVNTAKILLDLGVNRYVQTGVVVPKITALQVAARRDVSKVFSLLHEHGASPNEKIGSMTILLDEIKNGTIRSVERLLECGADPNLAVFDGWTPLHQALNFDRPIEITRLLLAHKADPNARPIRTGRTPLHIAVEKGNFQALDMMIKDYGADQSTRDNMGNTPFHNALELGCQESSLDLLRYEGCVVQKNNLGESPFMLAAMKWPKILPTLLRMGGNINEQDSKGWTVFHHLARHDIDNLWDMPADIVKTLLDMGTEGEYQIDTSLTDEDGQSVGAVIQAALNRKKELEEMVMPLE